jgi:hypothetical protein
VCTRRLGGTKWSSAVCDVGHGHRPERLERCSSLSSAQATGMGLGLSVCKTIVKSHGGRIWAEQSIGGGRSLPCRAAAMAEASTRAQRPRSLTAPERAGAVMAGVTARSCAARRLVPSDTDGKDAMQLRSQISAGFALPPTLAAARARAAGCRIGARRSCARATPSSSRGARAQRVRPAAALESQEEPRRVSGDVYAVHRLSPSTPSARSSATRAAGARC